MLLRKLLVLVLLLRGVGGSCGTWSAVGLVPPHRVILCERQPRDGCHPGSELGQCLTQGYSLPHPGGHNVRLLDHHELVHLLGACLLGLLETVHLGAVLTM